jgi:CRISPR/Cas system-associated endonuclease Cas1
LASDPNLQLFRPFQVAYYATCAAALTIEGKAKDLPQPDEATKTRLRTQAQSWLKAELALWAKLLTADPKANQAVIVETLTHWKEDTELSSIRDPKALEKLPEAERKGWQMLWSEVDALLAKARGGK